MFIIIALGESLLASGTTFAAAEASTATTAAFVVAFLGSVALWWVYFHYSADQASRVLAAAADPGRLLRTAGIALAGPCGRSGRRSAEERVPGARPRVPARRNVDPP